MKKFWGRRAATFFDESWNVGKFWAASPIRGRDAGAALSGGLQLGSAPLLPATYIVSMCMDILFLAIYGVRGLLRQKRDQSLPKLRLPNCASPDALEDLDCFTLTPSRVALERMGRLSY